MRPDATAGEPGAPDLPTIFFLNAGVIDHVGPAGLWVRLARQWAEAGFRAIRFDLSGNGDSPVPVSYTHLDVYKRQRRGRARRWRT